jgi:hypothetical protein
VPVGATVVVGTGSVVPASVASVVVATGMVEVAEA